MTTTLTSKPARTLDSWDTNYPTTRKIYRSDSGMYGSMVFSDVRTFIHSDDYVIKDTIALRMFRTSHDAVQSMSDEEKVIAIHKYAIDNFKYVGDDKSSKTDR